MIVTMIVIVIIIIIIIVMLALSGGGSNGRLPLADRSSTLSPPSRTCRSAMLLSATPSSPAAPPRPCCLAGTCERNLYWRSDAGVRAFAFFSVLGHFDACPKP
jgi:hypothetical protein